MKTILAVLLAMAVVSPVYAEDVKTEIDKQNEAFDRAYAAHDFNTLGKFYAEDAVVYPQGSDVVKGREAIQKLWQSFEKDMTALNDHTVEVIDAGNYAIVFGEYDSSYQGKPDQGRFMAVWEKDGENWKIVRDSWYSNQ